MKYFLALFLIISNLTGKLVAGSFDNFNPFESKASRLWKEDMLDKIKAGFEGLVPREEQVNWKTYEEKPFLEVGKAGCCLWILNKETKNDYIHCLTVGFAYRPQLKNGQPCRTIEEAWQIQKRNDRFGKVVWNETKINDFEGIIEKSIDDGKIKSIERQVLKDDWLIYFEYEYRLKKDKADSWDKNRNLWLERMKKIEIN